MSSLKTEDMSAFAQQGISKHRIRSILKSKVCPCSCSMPEKALIEVCEYFWRLPKIAQDAVLWSIQAECSQRRRQWYLQGPTRSCYPFQFFHWRWHVNFSPFFDLTSFFGQDILFAKKLGSAFWAWVATELHAANETIKGWTKGPCPVVVESCLAIYVSHKFQLCPIARTLPKPQLLSKDQLLAQLASGHLSRVSSCICIGRQRNAQQHRPLASILLTRYLQWLWEFSSTDV